MFSGFVPRCLGNLRFLEILALHENYLRIESSFPYLSFIQSLTNCRHLKALSISDNQFHGSIPASVGNLSTSLQLILADGCNIEGSIPSAIGNLSSLTDLTLSGNKLTGTVPLSVKRLHKLQGFYIDFNEMRGPISEELCNLHNLADLYLNRNHFSGSIPECLGNLTAMRNLFLGFNMLTSSIPSSIWYIKDRLQLELSSNSLSGFVPPEIGNLAIVYAIDLSRNQLSGPIPRTIGKLQTVSYFSLGYNELDGSIPKSLGSIINLEFLDMSHNNLTGSIPLTLQDLRYLNLLDLSHNALIGEIPTAGPFKNLTWESFKANKALCGIERFHVPPCHKSSLHGSKTKRLKLAFYILLGVFACTILLSFTLIYILRNKRKGNDASGFDYLNTHIMPERISYYELLQATGHFDESNLLGTGSFGSVYKGTFRDGRVLAVKVFSLQSDAGFNSFFVECGVLCGIRHRNLIKVVGSCSNGDFKALMLEYMPNGSLEKWLYSHNYCMDVEQRLNIMIDVASALEYLHHCYSTPIVHCDLKPSNVLLDENMVARVSDFGIAKLMGEGETIMHTNTLATLGYIAPEYGLEGLVSTRCDVYSYGIKLMETFTRKRPSDERFDGDWSLKNWVESLVLKSLDQVIDASLLYPQIKNSDKILECASRILELALKCCAESPGDRTNMQEAVAELQKIKCQFLA